MTSRTPSILGRRARLTTLRDTCSSSTANLIALPIVAVLIRTEFGDRPAVVIVVMTAVMSEGGERVDTS